jgi:putative transposase
MSRKRYTPEQIIGKLREAEVALAQGETTGQVCRTLGIAEQTFYRWRREYGGLKIEQARRLKALEQENTRLRRAVADLTIDKLILQEAARETSKPDPSPAMHRAYPEDSAGVRTPGLRGD